MNIAPAIVFLLAISLGFSALAESVVPVQLLGYSGEMQDRIAHLEKSASHQMKFNLKSIGANRDQEAYVTISGAITNAEVIATLQGVPLLRHVGSFVGPYKLSIVGDHRLARIAVNPEWHCRGDRYKDWVLAATNGKWSVVAENTQVLIQQCGPVQ